MQQQLKVLEDLASIEKSILESTQRAIPEDSLDGSLMFIDLVRTYDYWHLMNGILVDKKQIPAWNMYVIHCAWPRVVKSLYGTLKSTKGFPAAKWTAEHNENGLNFLHTVGYSAVLHKFKEQYRAGLLYIKEKSANEWHVNLRPGAEHQFIDHYDHFYMNDLAGKSYEYKKSYLQKWASHVKGNLDDFIKDYEYGVLLNRDKIYKNDAELANEFKSLTFPYPTEWGNMLGYNASEKICLTMFEIAYDQVRKWMHEAGIKNDLKLFDDISTLDLSIVVAQLVATHIIHTKFIYHSLDRKDIDLAFSLTIWSTTEDIINGTRYLYDITPQKVKKILGLVTLNKETADVITDNDNFDMPLLIDMENGLYIRPISSLLKNPFGFIKRALAKNRKSAYNILIKHQEKMLRDDIYRVFGGTRFQCLDSNIKLKSPSGKILTDVDASIFDAMTNTLAIFQLKWQDYRTNSTQELRSKAKNLSEDIDRWASNVEKWFATVSSEQATRTFKIKSKSDFIVVLLFVVSREVSYIEGYGYYPRHKSLALTNYPYFMRLRTEIGPHQNTFSIMHSKITEKRSDINKIEPQPISFKIMQHKFVCDRYWFSMPDELAEKI